MAPAQQRRRRHHKPVPTAGRKQPRKRSDERPIGRTKQRARLLTSQHRQLVPQQHQLDVPGELGATAAGEQPQACGEGKVGEGEEHRAILPGQAGSGIARPLRRSAASDIRARAPNNN
jgi:hypothetical protein